MTPLPDAQLPTEPVRSRSRLVLVAIGTLVTAFAAMYVYAFFFASGHSPDKVPDRAWAASAEKLCAIDRDRIDALPAARTVKDVKPLTEALRRRADILDQANAILATEIAGLKALPTADATTTRLANTWLADYDAYLRDRQAHSDVLRAGEDKPFSEGTYQGSPMSNRMDAFARVNRMPSCQVPLDVA